MIADVESMLPDTVADLHRAGFHRIRARPAHEPATTG
ncbi:hypothetical protein C8E87_7784 [Paractinoplanes brasiliensis]|uniref:Uncharacterized protein n=1 Tax=Paractinoplanes brasiliensis TaxID=52695 RepID=A0A4R6JAN8_9ACTN|nr:hypothetical protein C8E87_7784 [Actinoplanes brasiliensis]